MENQHSSVNDKIYSNFTVEGENNEPHSIDSIGYLILTAAAR